ncbi:MAG: UDP-N-acetylmuramoyl-L-alanine--D-glutamate ligase [Candidatus Omnitrophica bacterium]|nr:UDP-N-acetylmuramoyl-L-alanine--D-glutamate ligase [Candidatus Omnitrophota bacterium]
MRNSGYFKNKKVTIVGLARSGVACANLLYSLGAIVSVTENKDNAQTREASAKLCSQEISVEMGKHSRNFINNADLVVISPGVPLTSEPIKWAAQFNKPVISEIEVGSILCPARIIAVTGANGKTTVTTLIGCVLKEAKKNVFVCGNIGKPFCGDVGQMQEGDFVLLEVSSFQLEAIKDFKPQIAIILNLTPNHLDRYNNMQEYLDAKKRIFLNQDHDDFLVLNAEDHALSGIKGEANSKVVFFNKRQGFNSNQSAVLCVGKILGLDEGLMLKVFSEFKGIEHRMEELRQIKGVRFINDSKATTADSAVWAINNVNAPIILIAGGRHKGIDYRVILEPARGKVKKAILIGEAKEKIAASLRGEIQIEMSASLEDAVKRAYGLAEPGYTVLFSPMCSSYDMFKDYEERGREFKRIVAELVPKN